MRWVMRTQHVPARAQMCLLSGDLGYKPSYVCKTAQNLSENQKSHPTLAFVALFGNTAAVLGSST